MAKRTKKQTDLPNVEGPGVSAVCITAIDSAAEAYIKLRDKRCQITPSEVAAKTKLIATIKENEEKIGRNGEGEIIYHYDGQVIRLKPGKEKLSIRSDEEDGKGKEDE